MQKNNSSVDVNSINVQQVGELFEYMMMKRSGDYYSISKQHIHVDKGLVGGEDAAVFSVLEGYGNFSPSFTADAYAVIHNGTTYSMSFRGDTDTFDSTDNKVTRDKIIGSFRFTEFPQYPVQRTSFSNFLKNSSQISHDMNTRAETLRVLAVTHLWIL